MIESQEGGEPESRKRKSVFRDIRIDRLISWVLVAVAGIALSMGAYFFNKLDGTLGNLTTQVTQFKIEVAVLNEKVQNYSRMQQQLDKLEDWVRELAKEGRSRP